MRLRSIASAILIVVALGFAALPVGAEPLAQGCEGLVNAGFEDGFSERGAGEVSVANGWHPWWQDGPFQEDGYNRRPEYKPEDANRFGTRRIHSGTFAQKFFTTFSTHNAGFLQQVAVPVGSKVTFSIWVQVWSSTFYDVDSVKDPGNYRVYVGIDPTGGTDWSSGNIVWSEPQVQYNTWMNLSVSTTAKAGTVTVYTRGQPEFRVQYNDSYWDDACLTLVRPAPTRTNTPKATNTPTDTATPENSPTPTDTLTLTPTPTPEVASLCARAILDANSNGAADAGEGSLPGVAFKFANPQGQPVETYTTTDQAEPHCFTTAQEGTYQLSVVVPEGYVATAADSWGVYLVPGKTVNLDFAAKYAPTPTPSWTPSPTNTFTPQPTNTPRPTRTPSFTPTPWPTDTPVPAGVAVARSINEASGIIVLAVGLLLIVGLRLFRPR